MPDQVRLRLRELVRAHAQLAPLEHLRQLREEGLVLRESTFYRLYGAERAAFPVELKVRFEGLPGEFARFDFGQTEVELLDGRKGRVHFAAYRLKDSRWPYCVFRRSRPAVPKEVVHAFRSIPSTHSDASRPVGA